MLNASGRTIPSLLAVRFPSSFRHQSQIFFRTRKVHVFLPDAEPSLLIADRLMTDRTDPLHDDSVLPGIDGGTSGLFSNQRELHSHRMPCDPPDCLSYLATLAGWPAAHAA